MTEKLSILGLLIACTGSLAQILDPANGHYYTVVSDSGINWPDANTAAMATTFKGVQGHLATITSTDENSFVDLAIQNNGGGERWGGGFQDPAGETDPKAGWTWVNGEGSFPGVNSASPYAVWSPGEPNDNYGPASEQYLGLNWGSGVFNDEGNLGNIAGYVIEYDTRRGVPDAGSSIWLLAGTLAVFPFLRRYSSGVGSVG